MARRSFNLSSYAYLTVSVCPYSPTCTINIHKSVYSHEPVDIKLSRREWQCLANFLPNLYATAKTMQDDVRASKPVENHEEPKRLSDRFLLTLSAFEAPNGKTFITTGIRRYFTNQEGKEIPKREGGVNLSFEELESLFALMTEITEEITVSVENYKMVRMCSSRAIAEVTKVAEDFMHSGEGYFRLLLNKPETTML